MFWIDDDRKGWDSSSDVGDDDDKWTELDGADWMNIGLTCSYQFVVLCAVLHLWRHRGWPPYRPRQISLV